MTERGAQPSAVSAEVGELRSVPLVVANARVPSVLDALVGLEVGTVGFVHRDVEIFFFYSVLRCALWPTVRLGSVQFARGSRGYRAALCGLIGHTVVDVRELWDELEITLCHDVHIRVDLSGPAWRTEAARLDLEDGRSPTWAPRARWSRPRLRGGPVHARGGRGELMDVDG